MNRSQVIAILKGHESELRALGVVHLSLFGSTARDTATEDSDVDVAVRLAPGPSGLERLAQLSRVENFLSDLLSRHVDVIEEPARSPYVRQAIERDGVRAF